MERIKFYSSSDISSGYHFKRLKELIESSEDIETNNLLDMLEVYNILKFMSKETYPVNLSDKQIKETKSILNRKLNQFFRELSKQDILEFFDYFFAQNNPDLGGNVVKYTDMDKYSDTLYKEDFLECFEKYKLDAKISGNDMRGFFKEHEIPVEYFLKTNYFVKHYPTVIKDIFLAKARNFELVLDNYTPSETRYFIPNNITKDEMYNLCKLYIKGEAADLNYLYLVGQGIQGVKELQIDAKLKLKSRKRCAQIEKKIFSDENGNANNGIEQSIVIYSDKEKYDMAKEDFKNLIDIDYLKKEKSKENLLEYMMYFNGFFTGNWILNLCSFPNIESSTLMKKLLGIHTKKNYETSFYFNGKNILMLISFKIYQDKLQEIFDIRIEELIVYFFSEYSKEYFLVNWLPIDFTNKSEKIHIQTKNLVTIEEQLRKQWKLYIEENEIDKELFELEETPTLKSLKSRLNRKYIYINQNNKAILRVMYLLFSDQSHITYITKETNGDNFVELIVNNKIKKDDFHNYQRLD
ncbi:TPA: hypothetical protein ACSKM6_000654, partial [Listeria innocua]